MKLNLILTIISVALVGLITYGFYSANQNNTYHILITAGAGISLLLTLGGTLAVTSNIRGLSLNIKIVSAIFFVTMLIAHIIFSIINVGLPPYLVITGIMLLLYILTCYLIVRRF
jgi:hypothetical protein